MALFLTFLGLSLFGEIRAVYAETLPPGWTVVSPGEGEIARYELSLVPDKVAALVQVKRIDFDTAEETEKFRRYLKERIRYDETSTLLKNSESELGGQKSVVHLLVERRDNGTFQREIHYISKGNSWWQFDVLTTPELYPDVRSRSDVLLDQISGQDSGTSGGVSAGSPSPPVAGVPGGDSSAVETPASSGGAGSVLFEVPPPWTPANPPDPSVKALFLLREGEAVRAELLVFEEAFSGNGVDAYLQGVQEYASKNFAAYESLGVAPASLGGQEGRRLDFLFSVAGGAGPLRGQFFASIRGARAHGFFFDCAAKDFDALAPHFERIIASVRWPGISGTGSAGSGTASSVLYTDVKGLYEVPLPLGAAFQESLLYGAIYTMPEGGQLSFFTFDTEGPVANIQAQVAAGKTPHGESRILAQGKEALVALYSSVHPESKVAFASVFIRFPGTGALVIVSLPAAQYQEAQQWLLPFIRAFRFR